MNNRILVIDDEATVRMSISDCLADEHFEILMAENGKEGLAVYYDFKPAIIILDLRMPVMDGAEFLRTLNLQQQELVSVIVLTGHGGDDDIETCYNLGVTSFMRKPFNIYELHGSIKHSMALIDVMDKMQKRNKELTDFVHIASHDLSEPLRRIIAFGDRLLNELGDAANDTAKDYIRRIQNSSSRMKNLIGDLTNYTRISIQDRIFVPVDLNIVLNEVLQDLEARIQKENGTVKIANTLPTVIADQTQMHQLFQNLVGNGLKYHRPDVPPVVYISATRTGDQVYEISVGDNGIGFDEAYSQKIFEPFERLHGKELFEGTGIGLSIVDKIIKIHQGTINVSSKIDEGSIFTVCLPQHAMIDKS